MASGKRIGLFGGTFNPIHCGHLNCVQETAAAFDLEQTHLIPSAIPPHKKQRGIAAAHHRLAMVRLAVGGMANLVAVDLELTRKGPSYTVDTIRHYQEEDRGETQYFLILGLDALLEIDTWKSFKDIFVRIPLIVMYRPDTLAADDDEPMVVMEAYLKRYIDTGYGLRQTPGVPSRAFTHPRLQPVHYQAVRPQSISATAIRRRIFRRLPIKGLVPTAVDDYIKIRGLYQ